MNEEQAAMPEALLPFSDWIEKNPNDGKEPLAKYRGYSDYVKQETLAQGRYSDTFVDKLDTKLAGLAVESGDYPLAEGQTEYVPAEVLARPKSDDIPIDSLLRKAYSPDTPEDDPLRGAVSKYEALRRLRDEGHSTPEAFAAAEADLRQLATPEVLNAATRKDVKDGFSLAMVVPPATEGGAPDVFVNKSLLEFVNPEDRSIDTAALGKALKMKGTDPSLIPAILAKLTTPAGYGKTAMEMEMHGDDMSTLDTLARTADADRNYKLYEELGKIANSRERGNSYAAEFGEFRLKQLTKGTPLEGKDLMTLADDFNRMREMPEIDEANPAAALRTLSTGEVVAPMNLMLDDAKFATALKSVPLAQQPHIQKQREYAVESSASDIIRTISDNSQGGDEFVAYMDSQRAAGKKDSQIVKDWVGMGKFSATSTTLEGVVSSLGEAVMPYVALATGVDPDGFAMKAMQGAQIEDANRRAYADLFGKPLGMGYDLSRLAAPIAADLGAAYLTRGASMATTAGVRATAGVAVKSLMRSALTAETRSLTGAWVRASAMSGIKSAGLKVTGRETVDEVVSMAGRDIVNKIATGTAYTTSMATGFNRSALSTYASLSTALSNQTNPDGTAKYSPEEVKEIAMPHSLAAGTITAAVVGGFSAFGAPGLEAMLKRGGVSNPQFTRIIGRLRKDVGKLPQGVDTSSANAMLTDIVRKAVTPIWKNAGLTGGLQEGAEEGIESFLQTFNESMATGERVDILAAAKQAFYESALGGVAGGTITGVGAAITDSKAPPARVEADIRRERLLEMAGKLEATSPQTAQVFRNYAFAQRTMIPARQNLEADLKAAKTPEAKLAIQTKIDTLNEQSTRSRTQELAPTQENLPEADATAAGNVPQGGDEGMAPEGAPVAEGSPEGSAATGTGVVEPATRDTVETEFAELVEQPPAQTAPTAPEVSDVPLTDAPKVLTQTTGRGDARSSKRQVTQEGIDRVDAAKQRLRDIVNNEDIVGKQRADAIANGNKLISFLDARADTRKPLKTIYFKGDLAAFDGEDAPDGFQSIIMLEGANAGDSRVVSDDYAKSYTTATDESLKKSPSPTTPEGKGAVAPAVRDAAKPEQMTRSEYLTPRIEALEAEIAELESNKPAVNSNAYVYWQPKLTEAKRNLQALKDNRDEPGMDRPWMPGLQQRYIFEALDAEEPVSAEAVDAYGLDLPEGYVKQGELYVYRPTTDGTLPGLTMPPRKRNLSSMRDATVNKLDAIDRRLARESDEDNYGVLEAGKQRLTELLGKIENVMLAEAQAARIRSMRFTDGKQEVRLSADPADIVTIAEAENVTMAEVVKSDVMSTAQGVAKDMTNIVTDPDSLEMLKDMASLRREQGRPDVNLEARIAASEAALRGESVNLGEVFSNIVVGHPQFEAPHAELQNLIPIKANSAEQVEAKWATAYKLRNDLRGKIGKHNYELSQAKTPAKKKALEKVLPGYEVKRLQEVVDYLTNDTIPELERMLKLFPEPETPTPAPLSPRAMQTLLSAKRIGDFSGPSNADARAAIMSEIAGKKVPKAKAGVNAFVDAVAAHFGVSREGKTLNAYETDVTAAIRKAAEPDTGESFGIEGDTPMLRQYKAIKRTLPKGSLLAYRVGDFYEFFGDDARTTAPLMEVALTKRNGVPMSGVPYFSAKNYFKKLTDAGNTVAVSDQPSDVKPGQRKVTEILSPETTPTPTETSAIADILTEVPEGYPVTREQAQVLAAVTVHPGGVANALAASPEAREAAAALLASKGVATEGMNATDLAVIGEGELKADPTIAALAGRPAAKDVKTEATPVSENLKKGDRFTDAQGNTWEVWTTRQGNLQAHPVVNGKPVVNRESGVMFAITEESKSRNPNYRTDIVSLVETTTAPEKIAAAVKSPLENLETAKQLQAELKAAGEKYMRERVLRKASDDGTLHTSLIALAEAGLRIPKILSEFLEGDTDSPRTFTGDNIALKPVTVKKPEDAVVSHVSTAPDRYVLNGVYFDTDAQAVVATDGRRLAVIPAKVTGKSRVIASNDVKKPKSREIAYKKGSVIEGNYPNWKQVVPDTKGYTKTQIDIESVRRKAAVGASIVNMVDVKGAPVTPASLQASNGSVLNPSFVQDAVETLIASGAKTITLETLGANDPVVFRGDNKAYVVVMGIKVAGYRGFASAPITESPTTDTPRNLPSSTPSSAVTKELDSFGFSEGLPAFLANVSKRGGKQYGSLAQLLLDAGAGNVDVRIVNLPNTDAAGFYVGANGVVHINTARNGPRGAVDTVLHELLHAVTEGSLKNPTPEQAKVIAKISRVRATVIKRAKAQGVYTSDLEYALGSNSEFLTHFFTSQRFRDQVSSMTPKSEKNWVQVIADLIADLVHGRLRTKAERMSDSLRKDLTTLITAPRIGLAPMDSILKLPSRTPELDNELEKYITKNWPASAAGREAELTRFAERWIERYGDLADRVLFGNKPFAAGYSDSEGYYVRLATDEIGEISRTPKNEQSSKRTLAIAINEEFFHVAQYRALAKTIAPQEVTEANLAAEVKRIYAEMENAAKGDPEISKAMLASAAAYRRDDLGRDVVAEAEPGDGLAYGGSITRLVNEMTRQIVQMRRIGSTSEVELGEGAGYLKELTDIVRQADQTGVLEDTFLKNVNATEAQLDNRGIRFQPATARDVARFNQLTESLYQGRSEATAAEIETWREANPDAWAELSRMREDVLREMGYDVGPVYHGGTVDTVFDAGQLGDTEGFFFSNSETVARGYQPIEGFDLIKIKEALDNATDDQLAKAAKNISSYGETREEFIQDIYEHLEEFSADPAMESELSSVMRPLGFKGEDFTVFGGSLVKAFLKLQNPKRLNRADSRGSIETTRDPESPDGVIRTGFMDASASGRYGDGVISTIYSVVSPEQIKSAEPISPGQKITPDQWADAGSSDIRFQPSTENADFTEIASDDLLAQWMSKDKIGYIGAARSLPEGTPVGLRIDIPTFNRSSEAGTPVYAVTIHEKAKGRVGTRLGYDGIARVTNPVFFTLEKAADAIRAGKAKSPIATVEGEFNPSREIPADINDWTPVGFNPRDEAEELGHSFFYDKMSRRPVISGDEAISVGNTVFVKNPVFGEQSDFLFQPFTEQDFAPASLRDTATGFLPDDVTLDELAIDFADLADIVEGLTPVNAENVVHAKVNHALARRAGEAAIPAPARSEFASDEAFDAATVEHAAEVARLTDTYELITRGRLTSEAMFRYRTNPGALTRLIDYLTAAVKAAYARFTARYDVGTAVALNRMSRDLARARKGFNHDIEPMAVYDPEILFQPAVNEQGFYSQLERVVEAKIPNRATPEQIMATVNAAGVKAEEIKWSGIEQALQSLAVDGKVPKDALLEYLRDEGAVRFEEVSMSDRPTEGRKNGWSVQQSEGDSWLVLDPNGNPRDEVFDQASAEQLAAAYGSDEVGEASVPSPTKFGQYVLPGGENYREVVLAMPHTTKPQFVIAYKNGSGQLGGMTFDTQQQAEAEMVDTFPRRTDLEIQTFYREKPISEYTSSHFPDVPNYVAHMRTNERDGGLFIEELQSDRHQAGRKSGYKGEKPSSWTLENPATGGTAGSFDTEQEATEWQRTTPREEVRNWSVKEVKDSSGVADAPFRTTWPLALFKRALRDAVAGGKTWIGWTVGETQNDRFDLSKQVDAVRWDEESGGLSFKKEGQWTVASESGVSAQKLPDYVGKDVAERLVSSKQVGNKAFVETTKPEGIRELSEKVFGTEMARLMALDVVDGGMVRALQNDKVRKAVVPFIAVDVVNNLRSANASPEQFLSNPDMVISRISVDRRFEVSSGIRAAIRTASADIRAKLVGSGAAGGDVTLLPALRASDLSSREIAGLLDDQSFLHSPSSASPEKTTTAGAVAEPLSINLARSEIGVDEQQISPTELAKFLNWHEGLLKQRSGDVKTFIVGSERELSGGQLSISNSGMKGFYDTMLPKEIGKYVKQWGGKVEKMEITVAPERKTIVAAPNRPGGIDKVIPADVRPIWRIDITPAMRESVQQQGQVLFQPAAPQSTARQEQQLLNAEAPMQRVATLFKRDPGTKAGADITPSENAVIRRLTEFFVNPHGAMSRPNTKSKQNRDAMMETVEYTVSSLSKRLDAARRKEDANPTAVQLAVGNIDPLLTPAMQEKIKEDFVNEVSDAEQEIEATYEEEVATNPIEAAENRAVALAEAHQTAERNRQKAIWSARSAEADSRREQQLQALAQLEREAPDTYEAIIDLRGTVNRLQRLVKEANPDSPEIHAIVDQSFGVYLVRSYGIHQDPKQIDLMMNSQESLYKERREALTAFFKEKAFDEIMSELDKDPQFFKQYGQSFDYDKAIADMKRIAEAESGERAQQMFEDYMLSRQSARGTFGEGSTVTNEIQRYMAKANMPQEFLDALMVNEDPVFNIANTAMSLGRLVFNSRMLNEIHDSGIESGHLISEAEFTTGITYADGKEEMRRVFGTEGNDEVKLEVLDALVKHLNAKAQEAYDNGRSDTPPDKDALYVQAATAMQDFATTPNSQLSDILPSLGRKADRMATGTFILSKNLSRESKAKLQARPGRFAGWKPLVTTNVGNSAFKPLGGLYAEPEQVKAFNATFRINSNGIGHFADDFVAKAHRSVIAAAGASLLVATQGSPAYFVRNVVGNTFVGLMNGVTPFRPENVTLAGRTFRSLINERGEPTAEMQELIAGRIVMDAAQIGYIKQLIEDYTGNPDATVEELVGESARADIKAGKLVKGSKKAAKAFMTKLSKLSEATEVLATVMIYADFKRILTEADFGTEIEIIQEASRLTKRVTPGRSETASGVTALTRSGFGALFAPFLRFKVDTVRVMVNSLKLAHEMSNSDNPVLKKHGRIKMASWYSTVGLLTIAMPLIFQRAFGGFGEDEDEAVRASLPDYYRNASLFYFRNSENNGLTIINSTFTNPLSFAGDPISRITNAALFGDASDIPGILGRFVTEDFIGENIVASNAMDVMRNKDSSTNYPIYFEADSDGDKVLKSAAHLGKAYAPRLFIQGDRFVDSLRREGDEEFWYSPLGVALATVAPFRPMSKTFDDMERAAFNNIRKENSELWRVTSPIFSPAPLAAGEATERYNERVAIMEKQARKALELYEGFTKIRGGDEVEVKRSAVNAGMSKRRATLLFNRGLMEKQVFPEDDLRRVREIDPARYDEIKAAMRERPSLSPIER